MPDFRRWFVPGGMYFFTVVTCGRRPIFRDERAIALLGQVLRENSRRLPFETISCVVLPDHMHTIWKLPPNDADFSLRWARIKASFTRRWCATGQRESCVSESRQRRRGRGIWQQRFWERTIRDEAEFEALMDYVMYNPVHHGLATCPHAWRWSTFARHVRAGWYPQDWACRCHVEAAAPRMPRNIANITGE